jgi:NAD(P)-dependent dehydrogenase (short-subunit alcohol dehydrogenase family)
MAADVCDQAQVEALTGRVTAESGRIDVLVCNADTGQPPFLPLESLAWQDRRPLRNRPAPAWRFTALTTVRPRRSGGMVRGWPRPRQMSW